MAEEFGDKTEAPTPRRRIEAREEGQVARSPDLTAACLLVGSVVLLRWFGPDIVSALRGVVQRLLGEQSLGDLHVASATPPITWAVLVMARAIAPLFIGLILIAVIVNVAQVGFYLNPARLTPTFSRLNPITNLGRMFKGPGFVKMGMNLFKLLLVGMVAYSAVHDRLGEILMVQRLTYLQIYSLGASVVFSIALRIGVLLLVLALIDYGYQRHHHEQTLRMSKSEVKEDMRRMEGDPKIKQRRRQIAVQLATKKLKKEVPTADVVVTNPTELAIALQYDPQNMHAPRVIAKGRDLMAQRIREIAIEAGVPILQRKPLARALYKLVNVGQEIPEQFYSAVAEILAYVYQLRRKAVAS
jgi:flagellar biosynthetic protein FlhB